jgi:hypothetical protein
MTRRKHHCLTLAVGFALGGALLAVQAALSQDPAQLDPRIAELRKNPDYPRLYHDGKAFLALPEAKQEAMRKLHRELEKMSESERARLKDVLQRYTDWLEKLPEADRQEVVNAPSTQARLAKIKELRDREWLARQPRAFQQYLEKLPKSRVSTSVLAAEMFGLVATPQQPGLPGVVSAGAVLVGETTDLRGETLERLKHEQTRHRREWVIAKRHWKELTEFNPKLAPPMPTHARDFGPGVEEFVKQYLRPMLSKEEQQRLDAAEGQWPLYPMTLVELADKHPLALPPTHGSTQFKDLPTAVQKEIRDHASKADKKGFKFDPEKFFHNPPATKGIADRMRMIDPQASGAAKFYCAVATYARARPIKLPVEWWPTKASEMSRDMEFFLRPEGPFIKALSKGDWEELKQAEGRWPEYPVTVKRLADKYGYRPPWLSLPEEKRDIWDRYRLRPHHKADAGPRLDAQPLAT